jgi:hypothetical protein
MLLNEYVAPKQQKEGGMAYQVFTFDEQLPDYLGVERLNKKKIVKPRHEISPDVRCLCCEKADFISPPEEEIKHSPWTWNKGVKTASVLATKKYKPVALKTRPVYVELPERCRIKHEITGDSLEDMPTHTPPINETQR